MPVIEDGRRVCYGAMTGWFRTNGEERTNQEYPLFICFQGSNEVIATDMDNLSTNGKSKYYVNKTILNDHKSSPSKVILETPLINLETPTVRDLDLILSLKPSVLFWKPLGIL